MSHFHCPWCDHDLAGRDVDAGSCVQCQRPFAVDGYRLRTELGRGGMGTVYGAANDDGQRVAVKVLRLAGEQGDRDAWSAWEMFERSSRILRDLDHRCLPKVISFARDPSERLVLVREAFDGGTLAERIESERRVTKKQLHRLASELLDLLEYLHGLVPPVIHRDIKPANIMFRSRDSWDPVLVDFDTVAAPEAKRTHMTIVASLGYAAPEQYTAEATPRSDLYGLGATLLHVATQTPPDELPHEHGRFLPKGLLDELDPAMRRVLCRLVEPDPEQRYPDAAAALADLRRKKPAPARRVDQADPAVGDDQPAPPARQARSGKARAAAAVAALVGVALVAFFLLHDSKPRWLRQETRECAAGSALTCWQLGKHYERGKGVSMDHRRAVALYRKSCRKGYARGCFYLGNMLNWGKGTPVDQAASTAAFVEGCDKSYFRACQRACRRHKLGIGVPIDYGRARQLCRRGCDGHDSFSCNDLALFFQHGLGVPADLPRAKRLFDGACAAGDSLACHNLAKMVRSDRKRFLALERQACRGKIQAACRALREAERR